MEQVEFGDIGYAVIDVEALMLDGIKVVEQVACVIMSSSTGKEVFGEKYMVYQPYDLSGLVSHYGQSYDQTKFATEAYSRITGDNPVHDDPYIHPPWSAVRNRLRKILRRRAIEIYAKGADLERTVFGPSMTILDLEWWGCPKYPLQIHDPLEECRFFAKYIPKLGHFYDH